jgi:hypothetical protein
MCDRFLNKFVEQVINKLEEDIECHYVVMYIDIEQDRGRWIRPPRKVCSFYSTKKELSDNLYDELIDIQYYMADIVRYICEEYHDPIDQEIKNSIEAIDASAVDADILVCKIFNDGGGKNIFAWLEENVDGGLLEVLDLLEVTSGRICLVCDSGNVLEKLEYNGLYFKSIN